MAEGEGAIVWLVDGREVPFVPKDEPRRPWLEESAAWGEDPGAAPESPHDDSDDDAEPPELVWV